MAYSDYGALIYKNGIQQPRYCDTSQGVIFDNKSEDDDSDESYFAHGFAGTKDFHVSIYKYSISLWIHGVKTQALNDSTELRGYNYRNGKYNSLGFNRIRKKIIVDTLLFDFKRKQDCYSLVFRDQNGDKWEVYYGIGVGDGVQWWWHHFLGIKKKVKTKK